MTHEEAQKRYFVDKKGFHIIDGDTTYLVVRMTETGELALKNERTGRLTVTTKRGWGEMKETSIAIAND